MGEEMPDVEEEGRFFCFFFFFFWVRGFYFDVWFSVCVCVCVCVLCVCNVLLLGS